MPDDPTRITYLGLSHVYDLLNMRLFENRLPHCLITYQRKRGVGGFFAAKRFATRDGTEVTDEIALNPALFKRRTTKETLGILVHEMVHLQQHHFGKPSRSNYHNLQWAGMMSAIGLIPSDTGVHGGKKTGQGMSHYIEPGGMFDVVAGAIVEGGFDFRFVDDVKGYQPGVEPDDEPGVEPGEPDDEEERQRVAKNKTSYNCPVCGLKAWAKPSVNLVCGDCDERMCER